MTALDAPPFDGGGSMHMPHGGTTATANHGISAPQLSYEGLDVDDIFRPSACMASHGSGATGERQSGMRQVASNRLHDGPPDSLVTPPHPTHSPNQSCIEMI